MGMEDEEQRLAEAMLAAAAAALRRFDNVPKSVRDELCQGAFEEVFRNRVRGLIDNDTQRALLWMAGKTARQRAIDWLRRHKRTEDDDTEPHDKRSSVEDRLVAADFVRALLARAPENYATILWQTEIEGWNAAEVLARQGILNPTPKQINRIHKLRSRAKLWLRREIVREGGWP